MPNNYGSKFESVILYKKAQKLSKIILPWLMSIVLGCSVLHIAVVPFQLGVLLVESAKFNEASFYSSS